MKKIDLGTVSTRQLVGYRWWLLLQWIIAHTGHDSGTALRFIIRHMPAGYKPAYGYPLKMADLMRCPSLDIMESLEKYAMKYGLVYPNVIDVPEALTEDQREPKGFPKGSVTEGLAVPLRLYDTVQYYGEGKGETRRKRLEEREARRRAEQELP